MYSSKQAVHHLENCANKTVRTAAQKFVPAINAPYCLDICASNLMQAVLFLENRAKSMLITSSISVLYLMQPYSQQTGRTHLEFCAILNAVVL